MSKTLLQTVKIQLVNREDLLKAMATAIDGFKSGIVNNCCSIRASPNPKRSKTFYCLNDETIAQLEACLWIGNQGHDVYGYNQLQSSLYFKKHIMDSECFSMRGLNEIISDFYHQSCPLDRELAPVCWHT
jgi:hypothetical protein